MANIYNYIYTYIYDWLCNVHHGSKLKLHRSNYGVSLQFAE